MTTVFALLVCFGLLPAGVITVYTVYLVMKRRQYSHIPSPPMSNFFVGHAPIMLELAKNGRHRGHYFLECFHSLGRVFIIWLFHSEMLVICDAKAIHSLFSDHLSVPKSKTFDQLKGLYGCRFLGKSVSILRDHKKWESKSKLIAPLFHRSSLQSFIRPFNDAVDAFLSRLNVLSENNEPIAMAQSFLDLTIDVIGRVALGINISSFQDIHPHPQLALQTMNEGLFELICNPVMAYLPQYANRRRQVVKAGKALRQFGHQCVSQRLQELKEGHDCQDDVITKLVRAAMADPSLDREEIVDDVLGIFFAGHDTTATALTSALMELLRRPALAERLREEADDVLGSDTFISFQKVQALGFASQLFRETLRRYPPALSAARYNEKPMEICGYAIPAHTNMEPSFYVVHHLEEYWKDPDDFKPERFASPDQTKQTAPAFYPFGHGLRICKGRVFSEIEFKITIARLMQKFDVTAMEGELTDRLRSTILVYPDTQLRCWLLPRRT